MPELQARWGYPILLVVMVVVALAMIIYFQHKGWLGERRRGAPQQPHASGAP
jgi:hypothetical protein